MNDKKQEESHSKTIPVFRLHGSIVQATDAQHVITISKKNIPRAVDRNRIRRRTQEILRKNKNTADKTITLQYCSKDILSSQELTQQITNLLKKYDHTF